MLKKTIIPILKNKQTTNLFVYGLGQFFNLATPLFVVPHIVHVCGVTGFGKTSIAMAISFFMMVFIDYGSDITGVRNVAVARENVATLQKIFTTIYATKFVLLLAVLFFASVAFYLVPFCSSEKAMFFLGLPIVVGQFINPTWFLQGTENFKWITILTIISKLIYLFGIYVFIKLPQDYIYINLFWGIGTIVAHSIAFIYIYNKFGFSFENVTKKCVLKILRDNFSIFGSQTFVSLQMYAPILLLGTFGNSFLAGQYKIIDQIIVIFKTYIYLFFNFLYPRICYLVEKEIKKGLQFWKLANGANFIFIAFSMLLIYFFSDQAVFFFTKKINPEISSLLCLAVSIPLLLAISVPFKQLILAFGKQRLYVRFTMFVVVVNLISMVVLIPVYKIYGVIWSLILTEIFTIFIYYISIKSKLTSKAE